MVIELDMVPSGRYAQRLVRVGEDGTFVTEPVPIVEGEAVGQPGYYEDLGAARAGTATTVPIADAIPDWDQRAAAARHRR